MAIRPIKFNEDGSIEIWHDERNHGGTVQLIDVKYAKKDNGTDDERFIILVCPVTGCNSKSTHPVVGSDSEIMRQLIEIIPPPSLEIPLDYLKKAKFYKIDSAYQTELYSSFTSAITALEYDYSKESEKKWKELLDAVKEGDIPDTMFPFDITIRNGTLVPHTKDQLLQLRSEITARKLGLYAKWQQLVNAGGPIWTAVSAEELNTVVW